MDRRSRWSLYRVAGPKFPIFCNEIGSIGEFTNLILVDMGQPEKSRFLFPK